MRRLNGGAQLCVIIITLVPALVVSAAPAASWISRRGARSFQYDTNSWYFQVPLPNETWMHQDVCDFSQPSFVVSASPSCANRAPTVGSCCADCSVPPPQGSQCVCPPAGREQFSCIDYAGDPSSREFITTGFASPTSPAYFAVPFLSPACRSQRLILNALSGDPNLEVETASIAFAKLSTDQKSGLRLSPYTRRVRNFPGDDSFSVCLALNATSTDPDGAARMSDIYSLGETPSWIFVTVSASSISTFRLTLSERTDQLVDIVELSSRVPATILCSDADGNVVLNCSSDGTDDNQCGLTSMNWYPDPPYAFHAIGANILNESTAEPSRTPGLSVLVPVSIVTDRGSQIPLIPDAQNVTQCIVSMPTLQSPVFQAFTVAEDQLPVRADTCDFAQFNQLLQAVNDKAIELETDVDELNTELGSIALIHGSLISSQQWVACNALLDSFVELSLSDQALRLNSSRCVSEFGSPEWDSDPCCNASLATQQCCAPREIDLTPSEATSVRAALDSQCSTPKCSGTVATRQMEARQRRIAAAETCRESIVPQVSDPEIFVDIVTVCRQLLDSYRRSEVTCLDNTDCYTSCSAGTCDAPRSTDVPYQSALSKCLLSEMPETVKAVFLAGRNASAVMESYFGPGCDQGSRIIPDDTLDTPETCAAAMACNSDPNLSQSECATLINEVGADMCATCDEFGCTELSEFPGCLVYPLVNSLAECRQILNGVWRHNRCYIAGVSTRGSCLVPYDTETDCSAQYWGKDTCGILCYMSFTREFDDANKCTCGGNTLVFPEMQRIQEYCDEFVWDERSGICSFKWSPERCASFGLGNLLLTLNRGGSWIGRRLLTDSTSCLSGGDVCSAAACGDCAAAECGSCSDGNLNGYCWVPFQSILTSTGVVQSCPAPHAQDPLEDGCLDRRFTAQSCGANGGEWRFPSNSSNVCESYKACFEPGALINEERSPISFTPKPSSECELCGLQMRDTTAWQQGTTIRQNGRQWMRRQWVNNTFSWGTVFKQAEFEADLASARSSFLFLGYQSVLSCLTGQDQAALSNLACDCTSTGSSDCYGSSLSFNAISTRVCGLYETTIVIPGRVRVEIDQAAQFRQGCLGLTVDIVDPSTFARSSSSVISSAFVQSLQLKKLSVVVNGDDVVVGQLTSNGYQVVFGTTDELANNYPLDVIAGEVRICVAKESVSRQSGWTKLSVARARAQELGDFTQAKFTLLQNMEVIPPLSEGDPYCFPVEKSGIYALAWHLPGGSSASFFDTLTADQQAALIIVIVVYFFLWLFISIALGNFALWWTIQRVAVKFSVDTGKATINFTLLWFASIIRWIYFLVVSVGAAGDMPRPVEIFMVELPLFFFFSVLTVIILKWLEVARKSGGKNKKPPLLSVSNAVSVILNVIMYGLLIIFVILSSVGVAEEDPGKCSTGKTKENPALSITYHVLVAVICFGLGASFIVIGTKVTVQLLRLGGATSQKVRFIQFTSVAAACSIAMILQAILLVVTTAVVVPSIVAIIILIIVEVIPIILLIWTWNKPIAITKVISSIASLGTSQSATTSSGRSTSRSGSDGVSTDNSTTDATSSASSEGGGGLARLWSLGTDSFDAMSLAEEE